MGSSQKKSFSSYLNHPSLGGVPANNESQKKKTAYKSVTSNTNGSDATQQLTANKMSNTKSNAPSESTTLKKMVPAHVVKHVARHQSQEPPLSTSVSHASTNTKLFQRVRTSKVEKHVAMTSLANTSGNKSQYMAQSAAPRSMSQHVA